ncbi:MAG: S26 family signal peptidase, partial [Oscillospiraceae bacterium]|nr:S26 family signal peptidase [Oscillospiraceae bacterium]
MSGKKKEEKQEKLTEEELLAKKKQQRKKDNISMLITVILTLILFECIFVLHKIPSSSMEPTIRTRSIAICWRLPYLLGDPAPQHGDIVSFRDPDSSKI